MIQFSNGHVFEYMTASGALGFDGKGWPWDQPLRWAGLLEPSLFTSVFRTLTLKPLGEVWRWNSIIGNMSMIERVRLIPNGVLNAVRLLNPGIDWWCKKVGPSVNSTKIPLVGSIFGEPEELAEMAKILNDFDLVGLEINASCPNTETDILQNTTKVIKNCEVVKKNSCLPLILKISVVHDAEQIVKRVENFIEAFSINSVPWTTLNPNPNCRSPLANLGGGGISGKAAQPFTWGLVKKLVGLTSIPVIGPSIWDFGDLGKVRNLGAKAISFGAIHLRLPFGPALPTWYVGKELAAKKSSYKLFE